MSDEPLPTGEAEVPWRRLHFASVLVNLLPRTWRVLRTGWILLVPLVWRGESDWTRVLDLSILLFFFTTTVGATVRHWATLRYRVAGGRLEIRSGILYRRVRTIDPARIQNIELVRNVFHRVSGLVEVSIETASGKEVEGELSALRVQDAENLVAQLERLRDRARPAIDETEEPELLVRTGLVDLVRYGGTATRWGAALVVVGLGFEWLQGINPEEALRVGGGVSRDVLLVGVVALLTGTWLGGTVTAVLRFFGFSLRRKRDALVAESGLFTKRKVELPLAKVQVVSVSEPLLRRVVGFGSVMIETATTRRGQGGTSRASTLVPVVEAEDLADLVRVALPESDADPWSVTLKPPHPRALTRGILANLWRAAAVIAIASFVAWPWGVLSVVLVPIAVGFAVMSYRHQGWLVTDRLVIARSGYWNRRSVVVSRRKLQSLHAVQGPLLRRWGLGRVTLRVAGNSVALPIIAWDEALDVVAQLTPRLPPPPEPAPATAPTGSPPSSPP